MTGKILKEIVNKFGDNDEIFFEDIFEHRIYKIGSFSIWKDYGDQRMICLTGGEGCLPMYEMGKQSGKECRKMI